MVRLLLAHIHPQIGIERKYSLILSDANGLYQFENSFLKD